MDKLLGFTPDMDPCVPGVITSCTNLIPYEQGMRGARLARSGGHLVRGGEREGEGSEHRLERAHPGKRRDVQAGSLSLEVP